MIQPMKIMLLTDEEMRKSFFGECKNIPNKKKKTFFENKKDDRTNAQKYTGNFLDKSPTFSDIDQLMQDFAQRIGVLYGRA